MSDSLGQPLLLPADMEHYIGCKDDELVLKLKWHTMAICSILDILITTLLSLPSVSPKLLGYVFVAKCC